MFVVTDISVPYRIYGNTTKYVVTPFVLSVRNVSFTSLLEYRHLS